ncbi:MAG: channel protein TolC, partial [Burkholderiaceae bacterium]|nr:channel protein TolC [Burkholderiaceae bacterium]
MRRSTLRHRLSALALAAGALLAHASPLHAQNLVELYDAARAFDATYLAARAQADAATYRRAQADALRLPNVGLQASAARSVT